MGDRGTAEGGGPTGGGCAAGRDGQTADNRSNTMADEGTTDGGVTRRHEGICPVIDVKQRPLRTFQQDRRARPARAMNHKADVLGK